MSIQSRLRQSQRGGVKPPASKKTKEVYKPAPVDITDLAIQAHNANTKTPRSKKFGTPGAFGNPLLTPARRRELKMLRQVAGMSASQVQAELNKQS